MKIAYVVHGTSEKFDGVSRKIINTVLCWNQLGIESKLFIIANKKNKIPPELLKNQFVQIIRYNNFIQYYYSDFWLKDLEIWKPDAIYVRGFTLYYSRAFRRLRGKLGCVIVNEINTNDVVEVKNQFKTYMKKLDLNGVRWTSFYLLTRNLWFKYIDGCVLLNNELRKIIPESIPHIVIGDGINLEDYPVYGRRNNETKKFNVVFMGTNDHPWYGLDKIIYMARFMREFNFHFIGIGREIIEKYGSVPPNIKCYGFLERSEYERILKKMDVAIGSLSLHINEMSEGSPLKVREYLAYGLPVIIGFKDTDFFDSTPPFILELPSSSDNVIKNMNKIKNFIKESKKLSINRADIAHLDYKIKEKTRIKFIENLLELES
ncbi:glycosyltransferase family protein [Saccharococcus caldoxylosilyticus]|uniref:Glycosyl transferase family 1 domain-containing protein n=1 Tax=Saccharococcus caldoxylosilyticus TaxID=81408 RepID=A0A150M3W0_9BACL|nr:glycosyltransferase [Parageobacillus caldoxylosilyticus]KYD19076.1 hypothetical protein B4119_3906 [Parageobacillus caldoxylosilyticus]